MLLKEKISLETFGNKRFSAKPVEPNGNREAVLTHYLHNSKNGVAKFYKKEAVNFAKEILESQYPEEKITSKVAEEALQYGIFDTFDVPFPPVENPKFTFADLFAGIGGFRLALQNLGGKCVFTSEWDRDAKRTYRANFGETPFGDITKEETKQYIPDGFDVLCAGFPCQAFSIAGRRDGFEDTRGTLFFDVAEIIKRKRPKAVFLENVKNLLTHDRGNTFSVILSALEDQLGYKVFHKVLNTMSHANIPQNRERIFIVAFDPKQVSDWGDFAFPDPLPLTTTIHDFLEKDKQPDVFYYRESHKYYPKLVETVTKRETVYQWRRIYVRENKSNLCPTLTANMGTGGHNVPLVKDGFGIRKLTPKECFAFQGYDVNTFVFPKIPNSKLYMQAGNSVTYPLVQKIGAEITKVLCDLFPN